MEIVYGQLPEGTAWRAMVILSPDEPLGRTWQLGVKLTRANKGELLAVVFSSSRDENKLAVAREMVEQAAALEEDVTIYTLVVHFNIFERGLKKLIKESDADFLLAHGDGSEWRNLNHVSCGLAVVRGDRPEVEGDAAVTGHGTLDKIVVPTSGGPNTVYILDALLPLANEVQITAVYIASKRLGENEVALGHSRLRRLLDFIDGNGLIETEVIEAESVTEGIVVATADTDLVIIGASQESSLDKLLFGNLPDTVVRESKRPIMIAREPQRGLAAWWYYFIWRLQRFIPRLNLSTRTDAYTRIRRNARPDLDFFMLISLATIIAALGLLINSPAVVIGAMLVAPLMSPIVGVGLAMVLGDARFLRLSVGTVLKGMLLAIAFGILAGLLFWGRPATGEMMARTQPSLVDLAIAWFSGLAAAYALCRSDAAGALPGVAIAAALVPPLATSGLYFARFEFAHAFGAFLLFSTNFVSISLATALMFLILGFRPPKDQKNRRNVQTRSVRVALLSLAIVIFLIVFSTYRLTEASQRQSTIEQAIRSQVMNITGGELDEINVIEFSENEEGDVVLALDITIKSEAPVIYQMVLDMQRQIGAELQEKGILDQVALTVTVIDVTALDPLVPPTATNTPTATFTPTPGPTPTFTATPTFTPTLMPTPTATSTATPTIAATMTMTPTATFTAVPTNTPTATLVTAVVDYPYGLNLRASPQTTAPVLTVLDEGDVVIVLEGTEEGDGLLWQEVQAGDTIGWVASDFLNFSP